MSRLFLDTSYAVALAAPSDQLHQKAKALFEKLERERARVITTRAILLEIGNAQAKPRQRQIAAQLISSMEEDSRMEVIPLSEELFQRGFELFRRRPDKEWGLVDCISFEVMKERGRDRLTHVRHAFPAGRFPAPAANPLSQPS